MPAAKTAVRARPSFAVERFALSNGLRVVVSPDPSSPVVAVAVYYDVGMRSEPEGRTGFAHLFEHLMFQGSGSLPKMAHFSHVQGSGGTLNGSTHKDYTNYYEVLPSNAAELALFLEADRMRSIALTQDNLDNQVAVVQNEIRVNVHNRPYGGFPWLSLPPVLYDTFANTHDGYGSFVDLESATLDVHDRKHVAIYVGAVVAKQGEFVVKTDGKTPEQINSELLKEKIIGGLPLQGYYPELGGAMLLCATEMNRREQMDQVAKAFAK